MNSSLLTSLFAIKVKRSYVPISASVQQSPVSRICMTNGPGVYSYKRNTIESVVKWVKKMIDLLARCYFCSLL